MSKKIAAGADAIVLDVKVGQGAFMKTLPEAEALARLMVTIGEGVGRRVAAIISAMDQPLGNAVGNALEVVEAIETLQGGGPADFRAHCLMVAGKMLQLAGQASDLAMAEAQVAQLLDDGTAWRKFEAWIAAQGGDLDQMTDPSRLPTASIIEPLLAERSGYIAQIDAAEVGQTVVELGGGRAEKGDAIDYGVGVVLQAKIGTQVAAGIPLLTIHAANQTSLKAAQTRLQQAIIWSDTPVTQPDHLLKLIG
jgi:pyrimidine-nucleoside phosphorylase